ncbi:MAG TPA: dienelactone hydrolase family protein [Vicinamibacterales bacterium]|nr:dienelactone hydrolase family protein [Vicinamibacterales bacterium]
MTIETGGVELVGDLRLAEHTTALVVFAHGSGSSRHSPRNQYVANVLVQAGLGTLLFDLLTEEEEAIDARTGHLRFDIDLLARRLAGVTDWAREEHELRGMALGYFGASTGAAAALVAASRRPGLVKAIVSRGGRPDLAGDALDIVRAPTLLIVGERDVEVLALNEAALTHLGRLSQIRVVPGATHLFEEPGALDTVAALARDWFVRHLLPATPA